MRMLVGYSAGGGADAPARIVAAKMGGGLGQQVLVDTIFFADSALLIAPSIHARLPFDAPKSFAPVGGAVTTPLVVVLNPSLPAESTQGLIRLLRAAPGKYSYGSPGVGTVHHLAMELFKKQAGVDVLHVPYKGASEIADTLPGFDASPRLFILAPAATPVPLVALLNATLKNALASPDVMEAIANQGAAPDYTTPQELAARMTEEARKWEQVAKDSGAKAE